MRRIAILVAVLLPLLAFAEGTPTWVANAPGTGFVQCGAFNGTTPLYTYGLGTVQVTAVGDLRINFWTYRTDPVAGAVWERINPLYGFAAGDTAITVLDGTTMSFTFGNPPLWGIYVGAGDGYFMGE